MKETQTLFRPVGQKELDLIEESGWTAFPPRLSHQPIFYPVLNEGYAVQIARDWNTRDEASGYVGYVTRFVVESEFLARYKREVVGGSQHEELWIPAEDLAAFNRKIVGPIEVTHTFSTSQEPPVQKRIKVYLDDERSTPEGWQRVYWPDEAIAILECGIVSEISLDHDLGDDNRGTGYDVILWIEEAVANRGFQPPLIKVHSANTSAREKMERGIESIQRLCNNARETR